MHSPEFVAAVRRVSEDPARPTKPAGSAPRMTPPLPACTRPAPGWPAAPCSRPSSILDGSAVHAVNFGGGMHHAARDRASGFCIYNDAALAIQRLLDGGVRRVAYIDVDAHHGDGTQSIFWDDPRVLTISLHESGLTLFPGTGFANEIGGPRRRAAP